MVFAGLCSEFQHISNHESGPAAGGLWPANGNGLWPRLPEAKDRGVQRFRESVSETSNYSVSTLQPTPICRRAPVLVGAANTDLTWGSF